MRTHLLLPVDGFAAAFSVPFSVGLSHRERAVAGGAPSVAVGSFPAVQQVGFPAAGQEELRLERIFSENQVGGQRGVRIGCRYQPGARFENPDALFLHLRPLATG